MEIVIDDNRIRKIVFEAYDAGSKSHHIPGAVKESQMARLDADIDELIKVHSKRLDKKKVSDWLRGKAANTHDDPYWLAANLIVSRDG